MTSKKASPYLRAELLASSDLGNYLYDFIIGAGLIHVKLSADFPGHTKRAV
jgi:hypothetical protein